MVGLRWLRIGLAAAATTVLLTGCGVVAARASGVSLLILNPSSIQAGFQIEVRATCGENLNPAFVSSGAFGSITIVPDHAILAENVTIPSDIRAGTYTVNLACASGQRSSSTLTVLGGHGKPNPHHGPDTGGGEMSANGPARVALTGGLLALVAGAGLWLVGAHRRRVDSRG